MDRPILRLAAALAFALCAGHAAAAPRTVVTIGPVHALVAGAMAGVDRPALLLKGAASPHRYALKPSGMRALHGADLVFHVGGGLEAFLEPLLEELDGKVIALGSAEGVVRREVRDGGKDDMHVWLDPLNAKAVVAAAARALSRADPANAPAYAANRRRLELRLDALHAELEAALADARGRPFLVLHDAYRHFEARYGLNGLGAVMPPSHTPPGARRVAEMREKVTAAGAACVFADPGPESALAQTVAAGTSARIAVLDPLGVALPAGEEAYFTLMRELADSLAACLRARRQ